MKATGKRNSKHIAVVGIIMVIEEEQLRIVSAKPDDELPTQVSSELLFSNDWGQKRKGYVYIYSLGCGAWFGDNM